jgi:hypothetical protein
MVAGQGGGSVPQRRGGDEVVAAGPVKSAASLALEGHVRALLEQAGLTQAQFRRRHDIPKVSASRYFNSQRAWPWDKLEALLNDAEKAAKGPLTGGLRQETLRLWQAVVEPTAPAGAGELFDLMARYQRATAELSRAYFEIRRLEDHVAVLRRGGHREPPEAGPYLQQARLSAGRLRAQRELLRAQAAESEARLPAGTGLLHDPELPVPGREPAPPWWAEPAVTFPDRASVPPPGPFLALGPPPRRTGTLWIASGTLLVVLAAALGWLVGGADGSRTPQSLPATAQSLPTTAPTGSTPTGSAAPTPAPTPDPAPTDVATTGSTGGWTLKYSGTSVTIPSPGSECQASGVDFDVPSGYTLLLDDATSGTDLQVELACPGTYGYPDTILVPFDSIQAWGHAPATAPEPGQCQADANANAMPQQENLSDFTVGSAYCLVTGEGSVVWFKVTANTDQGGQILLATLWVPS